MFFRIYANKELKTTTTKIQIKQYKKHTFNIMNTLYNNTKKYTFSVICRHASYDQIYIFFLSKLNNEGMHTFYYEFVNIYFCYFKVFQVGLKRSLFVKKTFDLHAFDIERTLMYRWCFPKIGNFENFLGDKIGMSALFLFNSKF